MRVVAALLVAGIMVGAAFGGQPAVRGLSVAGKTCWAVGDGGLILRSDDGGQTWKTAARPPSAVAGPPDGNVAANAAATAPGNPTATWPQTPRPRHPGTAPGNVAADAAAAARANFSGVYFADAENGFIFGGAVVAGHPTGASAGVILQTSDGGATWKLLPCETGWLLGGRLDGQRGAAWGLPTRACPSGLWATATGGRLWSPVQTQSKGMLLGGGFANVNAGYLVGPGWRIVSLRALDEPPIKPKLIAADAALRSAAWLDQDTCWAVGDNGSVVASAPGETAWRTLALPLPGRTARLADLEAILPVGKDEAYLAGGVSGALFRTTDGGRRFSALAGPPGGIHALARGPEGALLAGGDCGRIWRSDDGGKSWKLVAGAEAIDVLFVVAAGDVSILPAVAAHAAAGANVVIVYAGVPRLDLMDWPLAPVAAEAFLRASAAAAGAGGAILLSDFASVAGDPGAENLTGDEILQRWSAALDVPARQEMVRQLAAAIRLCRPKVVARGPEGPDATGLPAENHLVSRLAGEAVKLAGEASALAELAELGLPAHRAARTFVGAEENQLYTPPWEKPPAPAGLAPAVTLVGWRYPQGCKVNLSMQAAAAWSLLPWIDPTARPADVTGYRSPDVLARKGLFTTDLSPAALFFQSDPPLKEELAGGAYLRGLAITRQGPAVALAPLLEAAKAHPDDPAVGDLLHALLLRVLDAGDMTSIAQVQRALLEHGRAHPLYQRWNVAALAMSRSRQWKAAFSAARAGGTFQPEELKSATARLATWRAWVEEPWGLVLLGKAFAATGDFESARRAYAALAASGDRTWRSVSAVELAALTDPAQALARTDGLVAARASGVLTVDGKLDEAFWKDAPARRLEPDAKGSALPATAAFAVAPAGLAVGIRLGLPGAEQAAAEAPAPAWQFVAMFDSDRDGWTQAVLRCDSTGRRSLALATRLLGQARRAPEAMPLEARGDRSGWTIELLAPHALLGTSGDRPDLVGVQFALTVRLADGPSVTLYLSPQQLAPLSPRCHALVGLPGQG